MTKRVGMKGVRINRQQIQQCTTRIQMHMSIATDFVTFWFMFRIVYAIQMKHDHKKKFTQVLRYQGYTFLYVIV